MLKHIFVLLLVFCSVTHSTLNYGRAHVLSTPSTTSWLVLYNDLAAMAVDSAVGMSNIDIGVYQIPVTVIVPYVGGSPEYTYTSQCTDQEIDLVVDRLNTVYGYQNNIPIRFFKSKYSGSYIRKAHIPEGMFFAHNRGKTANDALSNLAKFQQLFGDNRTLNITLAYEIAKYSYVGSTPAVGYQGVTTGFNHICVIEACADGPVERSTGIGYIYASYVISHEVGHNFGLMHPISCVNNICSESDQLPSTGIDASWTAMTDGPCDNMMGYVDVNAWKITTEQAYVMKATLDGWVDRYGRAAIDSTHKIKTYLNPPSTQLYDPVTPTIVNTTVTTVSWRRITTCDMGFLGFPDSYQIFSRQDESSDWAWRATVGSGSFPDSYSEDLPLSTDSYWKVVAYDSTAGWEWKWPTNEWWDYENYQFNTDLCTPGFISGDCPPE